MGLLKTLFQRPRYRLFVLLGDSTRDSFWDYKVWSEQIFQVLDDMARLMGCEPSIECRQITRKNSKSVKFGKIGWSRNDLKKWCHHSEVTSPMCSEWLFVDAEVFCPRRAMLIRNLDFPTFYIQVQPMVDEMPSCTNYDQAILFAVRRDRYDEEAQEIDRHLRSLSEGVRASRVYLSDIRVSSLNEFESLVR